MFPAAALGGHSLPLLGVGLPGIHFFGDATAAVSRSSDEFSTYELASGLTLSVASGKTHFYRMASQLSASPGAWVSAASNGLVLSPVAVRWPWGLIRGLASRQG